MDNPRDIAFERVAFIFKLAPENLHLTDRAGVELIAAPPSDFRLSEFDLLLEDIQQMRSTANLDEDWDLTTVEEFCALADRCAQSNQTRWLSIVAGWEKEKRLAAAPTWRRTIWRLLGV